MSDTATPEAAAPAAAPFLTITAGHPDDTQVAALTVLFAALASSGEHQDVDHREKNMWGNIDEKLSRPLTYNPNSFINVSFY